jgi:hypothetical protein
MDVEVCKTEWCWDCTTVWHTIDVDTTVNGQDPMDPRPIQPVTVEVKCEPDFVYFRFTSEGQCVGGGYYTIGDAKIRIRGDLGNRWYTTTLADPAALYWGVNVIPGAIVTRSGTPLTEPSVVEIMLPRDGYWADCCQEIEWIGYVYDSVNPLNFNKMPDQGWYPDPCECDIYPATVKKFMEIYVERTEPGTPDETEEIYCNSFEYPCEIY